MKKLLAMLLATGMLLATAACGNSGTNSSTPQTSTPAASASTSTPAAPVNTDSDFPSETITILVGFSAGGSTDLGARYMASSLEKILGVPVMVENIPGSAGFVAVNQLLHNTEADGYTLGIINHNFTVAPYDDVTPRTETLDDVELLINQVIDPNVLCIRNDETRFTDLPSFIEYAKENDILVSATSVGITDGDASTVKWMENEFGTKMTIVPTDSGSDSRTMFMAGDIDIFFTSTADAYIPSQNGDFKVICQFSEERSETYFPEVPTMKELYPDSYYVGFSSRGYMYPKGVDPVIIETMTNAMLEAMQDEEHIANLEKMGLTPYPVAGDEFVDLLNSQAETRKEIWGITD